MRGCFQQMDKNSSGELDEDELRACFDSFGLHLDVDERQSKVKSKDASGELEEEELGACFDSFGLHLDVDEDELRAFFDSFGLHLDAEEVRALIDRCDASRSGTLDRFEFEHMVRIMLSKPCEPACPACADPNFRNPFTFFPPPDVSSPLAQSPPRPCVRAHRLRGD
ncbi:hypothetical protein T484DRAFT_1775232 [Baffinella frigidus]|nr:hypothetical protein T484DRAFT_1775232 [Cryptophyta sp. CCMP2293]